MALMAMLAAPARDVAATHPNVQVTFYLDDRSVTCPDADVLVDATDHLTAWSDRLGLCENRHKKGYLPRTKQQETVLGERVQGFVHTALRVLGVDFHRQRRDSRRATARARAQVALLTAGRIASLPCSVPARRRLFRQMVVPKFCWGWLSFATLRDEVQAYGATYRRLTKAHLAASKHPRWLLEGHFVDPRFCAGLYALGHLWRVHATGFAFAWKAFAHQGTWLGRARRFLKDLDWIEVGQFHWHHASEGSIQFLAGDSAAVRGRGLHAVRNSWRRLQFRCFQHEDRRDSELFRGAELDRAKRASQVYCDAASGHVRAVLCGAVCSPGIRVSCS